MLWRPEGTAAAWPKPRIASAADEAPLSDDYYPTELSVVRRVSAKQHEDRVRIWVVDNGIGLATVRKSAERKGGQVGVESKAGEGNRFRPALAGS